jgi:cellulose synthase/poly-beta-1,6-N-acetylglucosamine synthase-like glycosyltransferase
MVKVSVIVPAYNAENTISECLSSLLNQNYPKRSYEIIVVDDGSTDSTREVVKKFKGVKLIEQKHKGPAAARNLGAKHAKGNILLFTDADCIPDKDWIRYMVEPFKNKEIVAVQGTYKTLNKESLIARFAGYEIEERHKKMEKQKYIDFVGTFSAGYRKDVFLKFGGFDESFPEASGEDPELSFRISKAGYKMVFQPKAFVFHRHPDTLFKFLRQKFSHAYWRVYLYKKHYEKFLKHAYTPKSVYLQIGLLGLACVFLLLSIWRIALLIFGIFLLGISFLLTLPLSIRILKRDKPVGILSPFIIILRDFSSGLGIIFGLIGYFKKKFLSK